ncbi:MAG: DUF433 domain-containing protein [Gemmataceae bacterium]
MQLEDYFDFHTTPVEYIRIRGTRIDIDHVIELYAQGRTPELIADGYPTLTLVQVYATITYYLQNRVEVNAYLERGRVAADARQKEIEATQPPCEAVRRIKAIKAAHALADAEARP